ncbi:MAG: hypothetical protein IIC88_05640 [Chloroflexi bacterium]|nr:hypothetical protein [Chloroflexota bacterium]
MTDESQAAPTWYCLGCATGNTGKARYCRQCGRELLISPQQRRSGVAFILNELEALRADGTIGESAYDRLRSRYREAALLYAEPSAPATPSAPKAAAAETAEEPPPSPPARPKKEGPGWLAEQQASLLLFLGAFLIVIATLIFVGQSEETLSSGVKMALLIVYTILFLGAGYLCMRIPRVQQAGVVFFAIGALMVPLNFVVAFGVAGDEDIDPTGLWLAGSLTSALFYGAVSMLGLNRWYPVPLVTAIMSSLAAALVVADAPEVAYPISFIALAFVLAAPSLLPLGRVSEVFGLIWSWAAHGLVPLALLAAFAMAGATGGGEAGWLIASLGSALFYGVASMLGRDRPGPVPAAWYPAPMAVAILGALGAVLLLADAPPEAYPGSFIALALLLAAPSVLPLGRVSEVFGLIWSWAAHGVVPLAFVAAVALIREAGGGEAGWLAASLSAIVFYGIVAMLGRDRPGHVPVHWNPAPMAVAILSALGAVLVLTDAPPEVYPGSFIALALLLAAPSMLPLGRVSEVFGPIGSLAAHGVVPLAFLTALAIAPFAVDLEIATHWYLPPTIAIAALFYWTQAFWARRAYPDIEPAISVAALAVTGGAALTLVYAFDFGTEWYGPAVAIVAWLYAGGSEGFGPRWFGQRYLGWLALGAITISWLPFEGIYADFPRHGAGVHFAAFALYLSAARLVTLDLPIFGTIRDQQGEEVEPYRVPAAVALIYAAGLTLGIGFYHLLASLPAAETADAADLGLAFFGLSMGIAAVAATMRWWWPDVRLHAYVITLGMSLFVLLSSVELEGQVALLLAVYTGVALAIALWERQPLALALPTAYGFFALLAAWRYYEPNDAYLPLAFSAVGYGLFAAYALLRSRDEGEGWGWATLSLAFGWAAVAPVVGWVRLSMLADAEGFVGMERFEETALYQTAAASVLLLGLLALATSWRMRRLDVAAGASALLMVALLLEIGHFRPENVQAYTAPLGVYLLAGAFLASRVRALPDELRSLIGPLQTVGAVVLMGPSLVQSWEADGWPYALLVLGEGLLLLSLALVGRWLWLLSTSTSFVVLAALRYLFDAAQVVPNWVTLTLAGLLLLAAGMAILIGREEWTRRQRQAQAWWSGESLPAEAK